MKKILDLPQVWLALFLALLWPLRGVFGVLGALGVWIGALLVVLGAVLMLAAVWEMARARTTVIPRQQAARLVTGGVFRLSRNPIYLGDVLILLGAALALNAPLGLLLAPVLGFVIQQRFILGEEAGLRQTFGDDYENWCASVRRWI